MYGVKINKKYNILGLCGSLGYFKNKKNIISNT